MASTLLNKTSSAQTRSSLSLDNDLKNPVMLTNGGLLKQAHIMWDFFFNKPADTRPPGKIPVQPLTKTQLLTAPNNTVYRLGHSTVLLKLHDSFWMGTFDLSMHAWREPFDRIVNLGNAHDIPVITPLMGEPVSMHVTTGGRRWWEDLDRFKETGWVEVRDSVNTDVPKSRPTLGRILSCRLRKTADVAGLRRGFCD